MSDMEIQEKGYQALSKKLGVQFVYFTEQFRKGTGDYTKEKYEKTDDMTFEQLIDDIKRYQ